MVKLAVYTIFTNMLCFGESWVKTMNVKTMMMGNLQVDTYEGDYYFRREDDTEKRREEGS